MLNSKNASKYINTIELLGCSIDDFKNHITNKFYGDMSWGTQTYDPDIPNSNDMTKGTHGYFHIYKNVD